MAAAYAALASLMHTIHEIEHHHAPPITLDKQQVQSLTQNITFLYEFLESYNPPVSDDEESADPLEMRIADAAYAAEDVIESHIVDTIRSRPNQTKLRSFTQARSNQLLQQLLNERLDSIKKMVMMSIETAERAISDSSSSSTGPSTAVVGFDEDRPDRLVIPIGKTTLTRYIFEQKLTKDRFYIYAWAKNPQQHNTRDILCEVFSQATNTNKEQLSGISEAELESELHKCLFGRRFVIVMDDVWSIHEQDEIQDLFPNNQNGSRQLSGINEVGLGSELKYLFGRKCLIVMDDVWSTDTRDEIQDLFPNNQNDSSILMTTRLFELSSQPNNDYSHIVDTIQLSSNEHIKSIKFCRNLQQVIEEMDMVNKMARMSIETEKAAAPATSVAAAASTFSTGPSSTTVVGFDVACLQIMEKLMEDRPDRQVIPIVGMGGIGKTTLARKVFEQKLTKEHFYICAWATISQQYNTRDILCEVYSQVTKKDKKQMSGISEAELGLKLHKYLSGRRFLIVMDDMWSIDAWDKIQQFFPNNQNGSRILVTTRLLELSSQLNNNYSHQVGFLDESSSWDLFSKTVFGENICPRELKKIAKKIVDGCRGLPLSIAVVGGLLKKMNATERCWASFGSNLNSVVNLKNDKLCLRLLKLSYNHLPIHLKPCFLYMGVFKEDVEIRVSTLIKLWISEGFLKPMNEESFETSAMRFLKDLVDRNLVLISKLGSTGNIKSCKIHDLLRDLCLKEGQKDGFYQVMGQRSPRCISSQRRIVIPRNANRKVLRDLRSMPHARSVICGNGKVPQCRNLGLLRTFHAYKTVHWGGNKSYTRSFALQYVNLRHLTIKGKNMSSFLSSVSLLWNLHTIIVSHSYNPTDPIPEIWKMPQLRHIEFVDNSLCLPHPPTVDKDDAMIIMENLQVLKGVRDFKCCGEVVKRIPNIKKLKIHFTKIMGTKVDNYYVISNFYLLCKLESLSLNFGRKCSGCPYLHNLTFPHSLKKLSFDFDKTFEWEERMLEKMASLPFLEKLSLWSGFFGTGRWEIVEGQFPRLKYVSLYGCSGLEHWKAAEEESSIFPCLEQVFLGFLEKLKSIPCEIGNIPTLQRILINNCNEAAVKSAKEMVDEQVELQGDQLSFRVVVILPEMKKELQSLSGPNFEVR